MKMRNEYIAPQITVVGLDVSDIVTVSFDLNDNWEHDVFGITEENLPLSNR